MALLTVVAGGSGLWAWLGARGKAKADLITIAQDAAGRVIADLREEIDRQKEERREERDEDRARIAELEQQDERCRTELSELKASIAARPCSTSPCPVAAE